MTAMMTTMTAGKRTTPICPRLPAASPPPEAILLFATKTCPRCKVAGVLLDKAGVKYEKLYVEDNEDLARHYKINQAPTLIVISGDEHTSYAGPEAIKAYIANPGQEGIA